MEEVNPGFAGATFTTGQTIFDKKMPGNLKTMERLLYFLNSIHPMSAALVGHLQQRCYYQKGDVEVSSWFMKDGDVIVSVERFYQRKISYEWIQALEDCQLYYISYEELYHIYKNYPEFNFISRELTQHYYILWIQLLYAIRMKSAEEKYEWLLERFPDHILRVPAKYLGSWLGISETHFSDVRRGGMGDRIFLIFTIFNSQENCSTLSIMSKVTKKPAKKGVVKKVAVKKQQPALAAIAPQPVPRRLKVMVSSSVYHLFNEVHQICGYLNTNGYHVLNSDFGTIYPKLNEHDITLQACLDAVAECDIFFGIISPFYGTSGFTHQEFTRAIELNKPRRFICHRYVTFARQLLQPFRFTKSRNGKFKSTGFKITKTSVMDDIRVIDMYDEAAQSREPRDEWKYRWVQEYFYTAEALRHVEVLFGDRQRVEADLANFNNL